MVETLAVEPLCLALGPAPSKVHCVAHIHPCSCPHLALSCRASCAQVGGWSHRWVRHMAMPEAYMLAGGSRDLHPACFLGVPQLGMSLQGVQALYPPSADTRLLPQATISPHPKHTLYTTHTHTLFSLTDLKQCHTCLGHFQRNLAVHQRIPGTLLWPHLEGPKYCLFLLLHHWSTLWAQGQIYADGLHVVQPYWYPVSLTAVPPMDSN